MNTSKTDQHTDRHAELVALSGVQSQQHHGVQWLDVTQPTADILSRLEVDYQLDAVHLAECTQKIQHNQVEHEENYLFFVLHVPVMDNNSAKVVVHQVGIFLGKDYLITVRDGGSPAISDLFVQTEASNFERGASYLLYLLVNRVLTDLLDMTERVEAELDTIEDLVFGNSTSDSQQIGRVRQKIIKLRRVIGPKRLILQDLADQIDDFSNKTMTKQYANNTKMVNRLWEIIEEANETVAIYKDADFTASTEQTNKILAVLTIIFTLTIPVSVVGTLYGMNVPLPGGLASGVWTFWGPYTSLMLILATSAGVAIWMYIYFKSKKWF